MKMLKQLWSGRETAFTTKLERAMFARLLRRLLFWYSTLLTVLIGLLTVSLGTMVPWVEAVSIGHDLSGKVTQLAQNWQVTPGNFCPLASPAHGYMLACYNAQGRLVKSLGVNGGTEHYFLENDLVLHALREPGAVGDVLDESGTIRVQFTLVFLNTVRPGMVRQAVAVRDPAHNKHILGVVQLGTTVAETLARRDAIVNTYLTCMVLAMLLGVPAGGWYFAHKALTPTRLAFRRQHDFIANVSHELGTPLALLRANADVLLLGRERMAAEDIELIEDIVAETQYMDKMIDNMLLLARMDANQLQLQREEFDLARMAEKIVHRAQALAERAKITLVFHQEESAHVQGDQALLEQVTLILLDNAIKYTPAGGTINVYTFTEHARACLRVSDTGVGIAVADLKRLGERFYRVDKARSRESGGSGLGLSIAYGILTQHGADLTLTSQLGKGTTATILLPIMPSPMKQNVC